MLLNAFYVLLTMLIVFAQIAATFLILVAIVYIVRAAIWLKNNFVGFHENGINRLREAEIASIVSKTSAL